MSVEFHSTTEQKTLDHLELDHDIKNLLFGTFGYASGQQKPQILRLCLLEAVGPVCGRLAHQQEGMNPGRLLEKLLAVVEASSSKNTFCPHLKARAPRLQYRQ